MFTKNLVLSGLLLAGLSACDTINNDLERGVVGAAAGAAIADATGNDGTKGAIIGGAAGVFCDDAGICRR
ncbi:hypothetical protein BV394_03765 [Brevirhabdus pacifica]|uniref:Uncharacterized protein n=1 Tax=Brevirhabdus pacifica TaxID=1267768 RepID=A0A1U7DG89_9RHOB|nr:hypothetical protein [Brevirhabdus pacifica]APX88955.1 hypothetical protein BV394_03765 [Brevirhabdus pacifica]OWU80179.1 hypothetical protein ATO5_04450 [Loktanella sp. 22II-4b]PJJ86492.1 hypothetical protein CLV77_1039 [Brevirhabdus pacifica]